MKPYLHALQWVHKLTALLFGAASLALLALACGHFWVAVSDGMNGTSAVALIEAVGLMAAAVVALQISETIVEEEILRDAHQSAPTRVRRFLSRFFVVVVVALAIEGLVATFKALHENEMAGLFHAAALIGATALLLAAWGLFVFLNRSAEELEPEAMERAKAEDEKVEGDAGHDDRNARDARGAGGDDGRQDGFRRPRARPPVPAPASRSR